MTRGIRGAVQVRTNESTAMLEAAEELMTSVIEKNKLRQEDVCAVFFTVTPDLNACFPAEVRSRILWDHVPFLCQSEIPVPGAMERTLRVLVLIETEKKQQQIRHVYLGAARALRPDLD